MSKLVKVPTVPLPDPYYAGYLAGVRDGESDTVAHLHGVLKILFQEISRDPKISQSGRTVSLATLRIVLRIVENRTYFPKVNK